MRLENLMVVTMQYNEILFALLLVQQFQINDSGITENIIMQIMESNIVRGKRTKKKQI